MALPWYGWAAIGVGGIVVVAIIANAASAPVQSPSGNSYVPPTGGLPATSTEAEVVRGASGLLTAITGGIFSKVARDDAARESALERADRLRRDERDDELERRNEDFGIGR